MTIKTDAELNRAEGILEGLRMAAKATCRYCDRDQAPDYHPESASRLYRWQHGVWPCIAGEIHDLIAQQEKR